MASSALLAQIQQGRSLKKAVTSDRSAPVVDGASKSGGGGGGGIGGIGSALSSGAGRSNASNASGPVPGAGGAPQLGGLFAGGMPKLKPASSDASGKSLSIFLIV
jgi:WAS/WASL-interacting protein